MAGNYNKHYTETSIRLGLVRFCYVNVFNRRRNDDGTPGKYEVVCIFPKTETQIVKTFNEAFEAAKKLGIAEKWGGKLPKDLKGGLKDGDDKEDPAFEGCWYFNARSDNQPGIRVKEDDGELAEALDSEDFYSGCYGCVSVNLFPYAFGNANKGVGVGLNNVVKLEDGERLSGGRSADQDFRDL